MSKTGRNARSSSLAKAGPFRVSHFLFCGGAAAPILLAGLLFVVAPSAVPVRAAEVAQHSPAPGQLNTTGRTIQLPVPVMDGDTLLGEANLRIDTADVVRLSKPQLGEILKGTVDADGLNRLAQLGGNELTLEELRAGGFVFEFDRSLLELHFLPDIEQRGETDLSLGGYNARAESSVTVAPADYSGYLNVFLGLDHIWESGQADLDGGETGLRLDLEGVMRAFGLVLENDVSYQGPVDASDCPINAYCIYHHRQGFKRRATRIVYDRPEDRVRVQLGDADTLATGMQNAPALLGLSVEKSDRKLAPGDNIRPTGSQSFQIVRPSQVDVFVNGTLLRRFDLRPGSYNVRDLPLGTGANEFELVITDDTGRQESIQFTQFFDHNLLAAGRSEWAVAGGVTSLLVDNEREYREDDFFGTGFIRYGLSNELTGEAHIQADARVLMGGFGVFRATSWGAFGLEASASSSERGIGYAASASWSLANFNGPVTTLTGLEDSFYLTATYQSDDYYKPGEYLLTAGDIIYPQYPYSWRTSANYVTRLAPNLFATLSGRYQLAANDPVEFSPYAFYGDRYGVDLTLSTNFGTASASLTLGYSNEFLLHDPLYRDDEDQGEFRVSARVYFRPEAATRIATTYDTLNDTLTVSANRDSGLGVERWAASVDVQRNGHYENGSGTVSATYYGNRAEVQALHRSGIEYFGWDAVTSRPEDQLTSLRVGTAIAFADGQVAVGAPIRGDAFAIVNPHESLKDKIVEVRTGDHVRGVPMPMVRRWFRRSQPTPIQRCQSTSTTCPSVTASGREPSIFMRPTKADTCLRSDRIIQ